MTQIPTRIDADQWALHFAKLAMNEMTWFDFLTVIDRGESLEIIARVVNIETTESALVSTTVMHEIASLTATYPGAGWYEREAQEMFGVTFSGLADGRPLLHGSYPQESPMRKSVTL
jgi:NADH:ubiquinone oxidoreductase subunit C